MRYVTEESVSGGRGKSRLSKENCKQFRRDCQVKSSERAWLLGRLQVGMMCCKVVVEASDDGDVGMETRRAREKAGREGESRVD
jgi:hypothetical protein